MAILFTCSCGKQLRAEDEFAGRKIKCPACTQVVAIPDQATLAPTAATLQPAPMTEFACACGKKLRAKKEFAGRLIRCPGCGQQSRVPGTPTQVTVSYQEREEVPAIPVTRVRTVSGPVPVRRRALWPWITLLVLLIVGGGGAALWYFVLREKPGDKENPQGNQANQTNQGGQGNQGNQGNQNVAQVTDLDFVPADAVGIVSLRVGSWWNSDAGRKVRQQLASLNPGALIENALGVPPGDIRRIIGWFSSPDSFTVVFATRKPYDRAKVLAALVPGARPETHQGKTLYITSKSPEAVYFAGPQVFLFGPPPALVKLLQGPVAKQGPLSEALRLADKHFVVAAVNLDHPEIRKKLKKGSLGPAAEPFLPLLEARTVVLTTDLGEDLRMDLRLTFPDGTRAEKGKESLRGVLTLLQQQLALAQKQLPPAQEKMARPFLHLADSLLRSITVDREQNVVHLRLQTEKATLTQAVNAITPAVQKVRGAATRVVSQNNLKQMALAMHSYNNTFRSLPPATINKGLSWRVAILPYLEQDNLYRQFHLDEPWDSPHNKALLKYMPKVFAPPEGVTTRQPYTTYYKVFTGPQTPFNGRMAARIPGSFPDGTSNTILIVEAGEPVPWTKPEDLPYDPTGKLPDLKGPFPDGFFAAMADGTVRWVSSKVSEKTLRAAITPAGGEILGEDWNQ